MAEQLEIPLCFTASGNSKVGRVYTFSLPSFVTCPGASNWCRSHCYAGRIERLRPNCRRAYTKNLALSLEPERFANQLLHSLPENTSLVRIHIGGDFYSPEYTQSWMNICTARPKTKFWSYTRSWNVPPLRKQMDLLRSLPNMQLLASIDSGMPLPPETWRRAFLDTDSRATGIHCPHQQGHVQSCVECGYCFLSNKGDVIFKIH